MKHGLVILRGEAIFTECQRLIQLGPSINNPNIYASAIIASVRAIEAFVNEFVECLGRQGPENKIFENAYTLLNEIEREQGTLLLKIQMLAIALQGKPFPRGSDFFHDLRVLIKIRNMLIHLQVPILEPIFDKREKDYYSHLVSRKIIKKPLKGAEDNIDQFLLVNEVATWSLDTAKAVVISFYDMVPVSKLKEIMKSIYPTFAKKP